MDDGTAFECSAGKREKFAGEWDGVSEQFETIGRIVAAARIQLKSSISDYIDGGASGEDSLTINRTAFGRWNFRPRMFAGISRPDLSTNVLGLPLTLPLFISPFGNDGAIHPRGHLAVGEVVAEFGITNVAPEGSTYSLEEIATTCRGQQGLYQMTLVGPDSHVLGMAERAAAAGYKALCFTDAPMRFWRERVRNAGLNLMPEYGLGNYGPDGADRCVLEEMLGFSEPRWNWKRVIRVARLCPLPWVLKGVLTAEDAKRALDAGASGIYVSNFGGRNVDCLPASLDQLTEVVDTVDRQVPVLFDSGVRHGTDVVKALALGADVVGIGRLAAFGLAAGGSRTLHRVCELLGAEMASVVGNLGYDSIRSLGRSCLQRAVTVP